MIFVKVSLSGVKVDVQSKKHVLRWVSASEHAAAAAFFLEDMVGIRSQ